MTAYLATFTEHGDLITRPYCSLICRIDGARAGRGPNWWDNASYVGRDDDHYEFDETCANCGVLIPASPEVDQ